MKNIRKKIIKILIGMVVAGAFMVFLLFGINYYIKASMKKRIITPREASSLEADCILVLGAGVWGEGRPSYMLEDRLLQGIELYKLGASDRMLMSGDHGSEDYDEVNVMKQFAVDRDVPSDHIFMDHAGFSTYDSMYRARTIFEADKIIIVTQEYHLYRALYVAKQLGLDAYGVASDPRQYVGQGYRELREVLARAKDFAYTIIKPKPTYLGEAIPVDGNGNITNDK